MFSRDLNNGVEQSRTNVCKMSDADLVVILECWHHLARHHSCFERRGTDEILPLVVRLVILRQRGTEEKKKIKLETVTRSQFNNKENARTSYTRMYTADYKRNLFLTHCKSNRSTCVKVLH